MDRKEVELLVRGAYIITMDAERRIIPDGAVAVKDNAILQIGRSGELQGKYRPAKTIDARGKYLFPGLVSTHTHLFQTVLKGLGRDKPLFEWLDSSVRRAYHLFDEQTIYHAALVGLIEAIRSGVTTVTDFQYCHPQPSIDYAVVKAYEALGIRGVLSKAHCDVSGFPDEIRPAYVESEDDFFRETEQMCRDLAGHPLVSMSLAPGIIWDLSRRGYERTRGLADRWSIPITMHLNETPDDNEFSHRSYGKPSVEFLDECGVLGPDFTAVHAVHMSEQDIATFRERGVNVCHCPVSNMILASGVAPVREYLRRGIPVSLAGDGAASNDTQNMLEVLKLTALLQKVHSGDAAAVSAAEVLEMATLGGARALQMQDRIGSLEEGKQADFFIFNPLSATSVPVHDPVTSVVYSSSPANIETTVVAGKTVLENNRICRLDEIEVLKRAQELAYRLAKRAKLGNVQWNQKITVPMQHTQE